jgi:hypothetical protein
MRNLHTYNDIAISKDPGIVDTPTNIRVINNSSSISKPTVNASTHHPVGYSQLNRRSVMQKNVLDASSFMDEQQRVLKQLIKEFQIFIGYREQLPKSQRESINEHSWSVYLMHAQSLQSALKSVYMGKALFGDGAQPPIRFHLTRGDTVEPFDMPDPCLISMISIRAFLGGISDHHLPSVKLGNACMAELLNALVEVQHGKERLHDRSKALKNFKHKKDARVSFDGARPSVTNKAFSWGERILSSLSSALRFPHAANA